MDEFRIIDLGAKMFELSSGCRLHRDPSSNKCKLLLLGRWISTLSQEDIPLPHLRISEHLIMLGVQLAAKFTTTRKLNGDILTSKVKKTMDSWKLGRFLPLTSRPWSVNIYSLSKL